MKVKTTMVQALERARAVPGSDDVQLVGTEALSVLKDLKNAIDNKELHSAKNSFLSLFGLDVKFFYSLEVEMDSGFTERGIGYLEQREGHFYLKRARPMYYIQNGSFTPCIKIRPLPIDERVVIIASSYVPSSFLEMLTDDNCIITCNTPHLPTCISLPKDTLLGRKKDNIEPIPLKDIAEQTKDILLKSSKIKLKTLQLTPQKKAPEQKGVIYYDEAEDLIKYYTGSEWRILVWQEA